MLNALILGVVVATAAILIWPRVANARLWRATITPLASIIGSGFLVLGPILNVSFGSAAMLAMLALCVVAYAFGNAIRYNIADMEKRDERGSFITRADTIASASLAFAFIISVAYYLNLFGAFGVRLTPVDDPYHARLLTTAVFILILVVGWTHGFSALERMEQVSVGLKLAIIAGLLFGLAIYFGDKAADGALKMEPATVHGWSAITLMAGLIVTVQGFETSRYLSATYNASMRIHSMRLAQLIASAIYLIYIGLLSFAFDTTNLTLDETAIIDLMNVVAPILPVLLVAAALSAQFSAAVADTSGSGGLIRELSAGRISSRTGYLILVTIGLLLTWTSNVFEIISYASRAFAAYYAIQAGMAAVAAWQDQRPIRALLYAALSMTGAFAVLFGVAVE